MATTGASDDKDPTLSSFYCWWRSATEFDAVSDLLPSRAAIMTPKVRVLKEMERLALLGVESLDDARRKLLDYRPGDLWVPTGGLVKKDIELPDAITLMVVGPKGSGKSSLVNLMYSVLGRSGLIPFANTSGYDKRRRMNWLEEHNVLRSPQSGFCVFDTWGFEYGSMRQGLEEMADWVKHGVSHHQIRQGTFSHSNNSILASKRYAKRKVNCIVVVSNIAEIYNSYKVGDMKPLEATREIFNAASFLIHDEDPMLVLTHGDKLSAEERLEARVRVCKQLGVSETAGAYDIACLNEYGVIVDECDPVAAYGVAEVVYRCLLMADQNHMPKRTFKDMLVDLVHYVMGWIAAFFAFLSRFFSQFANGDHKLRLD